MLAIHHCPGSFSDRWLTYCGERSIPHKIVNSRATDIIAELRGTTAFLWAWNPDNPTDLLYARQLIPAVEETGISVYPTTRTCWHFDDKVAQKYLLEAFGAPLVPCYVFYDEETALDWIRKAEFPKVFKLRVGSGSNNVRLVRTRRQAETLCRQAFGAGFKPVPGYLSDFRNKIRLTKTTGTFVQKLLRAPASMKAIWLSNRMMPRQKGYVYFQDFLSGNEYDTRVTVIGERAFAFRRRVRPGDFRASGSGLIDWTTKDIDSRSVKVSFDIAGRIGAQSLAFDYAQDTDGNPKILEISYTFVADAVYKCPGWWDKRFDWHEGHLWPQDAIIEDLLWEMPPRIGNPATHRHFERRM